MQAPILVTGAAGFIGANMLAQLTEAGYAVIALDDLSYGHREYVPDSVPFIEVDLRDAAKLQQVLEQYQPQAVMHFAALIAAGESVSNPAEFYEVNTVGTLNLLNAMRACDIKPLVFSSTAAVYGEPEQAPITLTHPLKPINPYGQSKLLAEKIIADFVAAYAMRCTAFRYFNVAGSSKDGRLMQKGEHITHLIPLTLQAASSAGAIKIYGDDYPTIDGTCIRDYIHVLDICNAHLLALKQLLTDPAPQMDIYNLGTGNGYSVKQVIDCAEKVIGKTIKRETTPRRAGDPSALVADYSAAKEKLNWHPAYDLETIIADSWKAGE